MGKIKLNLVSGAVVEKPLINAFKANNNSYVILDNELNGSMGLPIILVCKYENNRLAKINDQNEWQIAKEYLKNIIAGNKIEFIKIDNELSADDIYYTQLTLPVPSFDALKNAYKVDDNEEEASILDINPTPVQETPVVQEANPQPVMAEAPINNEVLQQPVVNNFEPATPTVNSEPVMNNVPVDNPIINNEPIMNNVQVEAPALSSEPVIDMQNNNVVSNEAVVPPVMDIQNNSEIVNQNIVPPIDINPVSAPSVEPTTPPLDSGVTETTVVEPINTAAAPIPPVNVDNTAVEEVSIFKEQKEAFMQACENMFDALVQKFEKELEK